MMQTCGSAAKERARFLFGREEFELVTWLHVCARAGSRRDTNVPHSTRAPLSSSRTVIIGGHQQRIRGHSRTMDGL